MECYDIGAQLEPGWSPAGAQLEPGWSPVGARLEPGWSPVGARLEPSWSPRVGVYAKVLRLFLQHSLP